MKIRSITELDDYLDTDLAWRKHEMTTLCISFDSARKHQKKLIYRSGIALLYAHWEGHIKNAATAYLIYLKHLGLNYAQLKSNFISLGIYTECSKDFSLKKFDSQENIFDYFHNKIKTRKFLVDESKVVDTESNLKSDVLKKITKRLGLDYQTYELKENYIDEKLLAVRNKICHGERVNFDEESESFIDLKNIIFDLIDYFNNQIKTAASNKEFLNQNKKTANLDY